MFWAVKNAEGLTNQSTETNNSVEEPKGTFLERERDQEVWNVTDADALAKLAFKISVNYGAA